MYTITSILIDYIGRKVSQFSFVCTNIGTNSPLEFTGGVTLERYCKFYTLVIHTSTINPRFTTFTHCCDIWSLDQDIICFLIVIVKRTSQTLIEKSKVNAEVCLFGCFPFQIRVTNPSSSIARLQSAGCLSLNRICSIKIISSKWSSCVTTR